MDSTVPPVDFFEIFASSYVFEGINREYLRQLYEMMQEVVLQEGQFLIKEGDTTKEIYILIEGCLNVLKEDPVLKKSHLIDVLLPGDAVGEVAFLDHGTRTASVQAAAPCRLRSISVTQIEGIFEKNPHLHKIFFRLSASISKKLRHSNETIIRSLRNEITESHAREKLGLFLVSIIIALSFFAFTALEFHQLLVKVPNSSYITLPFTGAMALYIFLLVKYFDMPIDELGITKKNLKRSIWEAIVFTTPTIFVVVAAIKWYLLRFDPFYAGKPFFDFFALIRDPEDKNWVYWLGLNALYIFLMVPLQELLSRGGLQGILEKFWRGKYKVPISIIASNLIFSSGHAFFTTYIALGVFSAGCWIGWLYSRTHNFFGVWIAHAIIGLVALSIFGIAGASFH